MGTDRSQLLAVKVLEHSIKRYTDLQVEVTPLLDLPILVPKDPRNRQRTGFSFARFAIPALCNYEGRAIYMDADMLVFKDIRSLWEIPFDTAKIIVQEEISSDNQHVSKLGAPGKRKKQCAVMVLDCAALDWNVDDIVRGMDDDKYNYDELLHDICILKEDEINYGVPFYWNSLEKHDSETCLIHYTDMLTQPWASPHNDNDYLWFDEVRLMLKNGSIDMAELEREVSLGYFRPSLIRDIRYSRFLPGFSKPAFRKMNAALDQRSGYVPHKDVYEAKRERQRAVKEYEKSALEGEL
ncbi:MAG: glycosyltransferase [Halieaceae bacterium]